MKVTISRFDYAALLACAFLVWCHILIGIQIVPHSAPLWDRLVFVVWALFAISMWFASAVGAALQLVLWAVAARRKLDAP